MTLVWTSWNNGRHAASGAGYGFKVPIPDRNLYFNREWGSVFLELPLGGEYIKIEVGISKLSFWNETCHELISKEVGIWLRQLKLAPWHRGAPPKIQIQHLASNRFRVIGHEAT